jgi:signal transduction histidine kinase
MGKHFKTNVLLKSIIGKDLINDDNIAVNELVKNSFDANSRNVIIRFKNLKENDDSVNKVYSKKSSKIIIQDFGIGMDEKDLDQKWLNIAYSEKKYKKRDFDRVLAGAKGVGRFSCDRLGEYLDIYTRKHNSRNILHLQVDWKAFEIEDKKDLEIQKIDVLFREIPLKNFKKITGYAIFAKGTILEISKLRSPWAIKGKKGWDTSKILDLKKSLEKLINPNQLFSKTKFAVQLEVKEFLEDDKQKQDHDKLNGEIKNRIFEKLEYTSTSITSAVDVKGQIITTAITDKGRDIFILKEKNVFPLLKDIKIVLYYLNPYAKIYFHRQTGIRSVDFGSVYLFINGFRIPPYGDFGDDWLGLEKRKGQGYARFIGTRELIGRVEVNDNTSQYRIVSSREGLVKDKNYDQLTDGYIYYTFKRLERYVVEGLDWDRLTKKKKNPIDEVLEPNLKGYITKFETQVQSKNWEFSPLDEKYAESQEEKDRRIIALIEKIIDVKPENVIQLHINEALIIELINNEKEKAKFEFEKLVSKLPELTDEEVSAEIEGLEEGKNILHDTIEKISNFPPSVLDKETALTFKKSFKLLTQVESEFFKSKKIIIKLQHERSEAERRRKVEEEAKQKLEEEKRKLQEQLDIEKEKNTYLRTSSRSLSEDAKGLVHHIKITTQQITTTIDTLFYKIIHKQAPKEAILRDLGIIKFNADKALKISVLITRSNFKTEQDEQIVDIPKYITQYMEVYSDIYEEKEMQFKIINKDAYLVKKASLLDVAVVLDNLISNSDKAGATKVSVEMSNPKKGILKVLFSDNGKGVEKKFLENPDQIFELGVTTTTGSGIGLNSVRDALKNMKGHIKFVGNGIGLKGATFEITFS